MSFGTTAEILREKFISLNNFEPADELLHDLVKIYSYWLNQPIQDFLNENNYWITNNYLNKINIIIFINLPDFLIDDGTSLKISWISHISSSTASLFRILISDFLASFFRDFWINQRGDSGKNSKPSNWRQPKIPWRAHIYLRLAETDQT